MLDRMFTKLQKWNYWDTNKYEHGFGYRLGVTVGYNIKLSDKFLLDFFAGGGWHQGFYHGYYNDGTPGRYEKAENWNKSGEWLPYRGGVMISYKLNYFANLGRDFTYKSSTFFRAQSVFLKKVKLDFILGFEVKHFIGINSAKVSKP